MTKARTGARSEPAAEAFLRAARYGDLDALAVFLDPELSSRRAPAKEARTEMRLDGGVSRNPK